MSKRIIASATLGLFINFLISCSFMGIGNRDEIIGGVPYTEFKASKFPEVRIISVNKPFHRAKLLSLEGENLTFLPYPYWNLKPIKIDIDEIYLIELLNRESKASRGFAKGFAIGFLITGGLGLAIGELKYDEDYSGFLTGSLVWGAAGGLLGSILGSIKPGSTKSRYNFFKMSKREKIDALKDIML